MCFGLPNQFFVIRCSPDAEKLTWIMKSWLECSSCGQGVPMGQLKLSKRTRTREFEAHSSIFPMLSPQKSAKIAKKSKSLTEVHFFRNFRKIPLRSRILIFSWFLCDFVAVQPTKISKNQEMIETLTEVADFEKCFATKIKILTLVQTFRGLLHHFFPVNHGFWWSTWIFVHDFYQ